MAPKKTKPKNDYAPEVRQRAETMIRKGKTPKEISDWFREHRKIELPASTISSWKLRLEEQGEEVPRQGTLRRKERPGAEDVAAEEGSPATAPRSKKRSTAEQMAAAQAQIEATPPAPKPTAAPQESPPPGAPALDETPAAPASPAPAVPAVEVLTTEREPVRVDTSDYQEEPEEEEDAGPAEDVAVIQREVSAPSAPESAPADVIGQRAPELRKVPIAKIRRDGGTQFRDGTDPVIVKEYAQALQRGDKLAPPVLYDDGVDLWPADGHHTIEAHEKIEEAEVYCEVYAGSLDDAKYYAATKGNRGHGLRLTTKAKRKRVAYVLSVKPNLSDREIARECGVGADLVGDVRRATVGNDSSGTKRKGKDGKERRMPRPKKAAPPHMPEPEQGRPERGDPVVECRQPSAAPEGRPSDPFTLRLGLQPDDELDEHAEAAEDAAVEADLQKIEAAIKDFRRRRPQYAARLGQFLMGQLRVASIDAEKPADLAQAGAAQQ